jgi:predicted Rossmann fold nucleotide-binding protein DprA/Smf involved in DNA uptake
VNRSPESLALALITNRIVDVGTKPLTAREFFKAFGSADNLIGIADMGADQIATHLVIASDMAERVHSLLGASRALAFELERLEETGVRLLTLLDDDFPIGLRDRLGDQCPASLLVAGPVEWLSMPAVGIVGSRGISAEAAEVARQVAQLAVRSGFGVTSGLAKGIDQTAMASGLTYQGRVCGLPAEGIRVVGRRTDVRAAVHDGALALASPFGPDAPFSVGNAMARNKLIYGVSDVTVVVTSDDGKGGTWAGATEALERGYGRVAVWMGPEAGPGNAALVAKGATPIDDFDDASWLTPLSPVQPVPALWHFEAQRLF